MTNSHRIESRPQVRGKFLFAAGRKLSVKGVTYGTFRPDDEGQEFHEPGKVAKDFAMMAAYGINAVRVYTCPPRWLLDAAAANGIYVMIGLPWEQHVTFLDDPGRASAIVERMREYVRSCAGHPAILAYAIGNEIPAPIVRWHGPQAIERFLRRLFDVVKAEDPGALVTYVNFPTTEYLQLPFVDLNCFNVYLETPSRMDAYLARLQNLSGNKPLLMAEIGLDSRRNGMEKQAQTLEWQIRTVFESGCTGAFLFSWTDEWHRGGADINDWDFGLTTREREPKPALHRVREAFGQAPFPAGQDWPRISVVVCSYNGSRTIGETLEHVCLLNYPDYEVIVVDDGSTDNVSEIAGRFDVRLIRGRNAGLSAARNVGMHAASGEIVAYIDDDAYPDPDWLRYVAHAFWTTDFAGVGGPNICPPEDGTIATCVAASPGGPAHVLLTDRVAEHIPGCNMSFRKDRLEEIGGFDAQFRTAGDDVDVCWRLQERGWELGFHPAAVVWHHRRGSVKAYWKQQKGYGKAEALLAAKWPQKYNVQGHLSWSGRVYGATTIPIFGWAQRIYHGVWGSAAFQSLYEGYQGTWSCLPLLPEWYLVLTVALVIGVLGLLWHPLLICALLFLTGASVTALQSLKNGFGCNHFSAREKLLTSFLHTVQPLARLTGRLRYGITPWGLRGRGQIHQPFALQQQVWSTKWRSAEDWLEAVEGGLHQHGAVVLRGGPFDHWDLKVLSGLAGGVCLTTAVEEHGAGRQLLRFRIRPAISRGFAGLTILFLALTGAAVWDSASAVAVITLGALSFMLCLRWVLECGSAKMDALTAIESLRSTTGIRAPEPQRELASAAAAGRVAE